MISVIPCYDKEKLKELYLKSGTEFSDKSVAVLAESSGEVLGFCLFDLYENSALIKKNRAGKRYYACRRNFKKRSSCRRRAVYNGSPL